MTDSLLAKISERLGRTKAISAKDNNLDNQFTQVLGKASPVVKPHTNSDTLPWFITQARANLFEVSSLPDRITVPDFFNHHTLPIVLSPQSSIQSLGWQSKGLDFTHDYQRPCIGIVEASAGIAETGTVVISSHESPSGMLFLCEELAIVLSKKNIVCYQEELWPAIRDQPQRAVHLISGPSRTADVEQTLQVGAHGPKRVYLLLIAA